MKIEIDAPELPDGYELTKNKEEAELFLVEQPSLNKFILSKNKLVWIDKKPGNLYYAYAKKKKPVFDIYKIDSFTLLHERIDIEKYVWNNIDKYKQFLKEHYNFEEDK